MDRASDSGSEGWGFESLPVYQRFFPQADLWRFPSQEKLPPIDGSFSYCAKIPSLDGLSSGEGIVLLIRNVHNLRKDAHYSFSSGRPTIEVVRLRMPARAAALPIMIQLTSFITAAVPMVATASTSITSYSSMQV